MHLEEKWMEVARLDVVLEIVEELRGRVERDHDGELTVRIYIFR